MRLLRLRLMVVGWLAFALLAGGTVARAAEIAEPAVRSEAPVAPALLEDPARPSTALTAAAIDALTEEDGAAAGVTVAMKALSASQVAYGPKDARTVRPLTNLAHARQRAGDNAGAVLDYGAAIAIAEAAGGPRDAALFDAWYGMGYAYLVSGQSEAAQSALGTALQLHRVNQGLYSAQQIDVLHALAIAQRAQGRTEDADALQMRRNEVAERVYGLDTYEVSRVYVSTGRWFRNVGIPAYAIQLHATAVSILEKRSADDPRLIEPLIELALSSSEYRRDVDEAPLPASMQPASALARAERLAEGRTQGTAAERAALLIRVGDVQYSLGKREPALRVYAKATALLAAAGEKPPFDEPAFVTFKPPRPTPLQGPGGYALAEFTVETSGRASAVRIVETQPPGLPAAVGSSLSSAIKSSRFRPRIVNGQPVVSTGVRYRLPVRGGSAS